MNEKAVDVHVPELPRVDQSRGVRDAIAMRNLKDLVLVEHEPMMTGIGHHADPRSSLTYVSPTAPDRQLLTAWNSNMAADGAQYPVLERAADPLLGLCTHRSP